MRRREEGVTRGERREGGWNEAGREGERRRERGTKEGRR